MAVNKTGKIAAAKDTAKVTQTTLDLGVSAKKPEPAPVLKEEIKPAEEKKETKPVKKTTARKAASKKASTRKTTVVKEEETTVKANVIVEYHGQQFAEKEIMDKVTAAWEADGKKASAMKKINLYVKPEDGKAYYVINEGLKNGSSGSVDL